MSEHNFGCDHDENDLNEELETMTLTLEDDTELECVVLGVFNVEDIEGKEYIALLPQGDENVLIYEYKELENEEIELLSIEDDKEFEKVSAEFDAIFNEDEDEEE